MPIIKDCAIWYGGNDLTAAANEVSVDWSSAAVDVTNMASAGNVELLTGLDDTTMSVMSFVDNPVANDGQAFTNRGAVDLLTFAALPATLTPVLGERVYACRALLTSTPRTLKVGDAHRMNMTLYAAETSGLLQGAVLAPKTSSTGSGNTTPFAAGAATDAAFLGVHIFSRTGDRTITPILQSDTTGFPSPTNVVTFGALSTVGATFGTTAGPTTDTFWRVNFTIGGTTGAIQWAAFVAIT